STVAHPSSPRTEQRACKPTVTPSTASVRTSKSHPGQADKGVESAERVVDERTGDKYDAQTDKAADAARRSYGGGGTASH
ncbi:antitoxin, partial [Streptomyces flavidovirens]|uniref:antitoxin n=1 Tax=Streptomyces flavidovirens TaxID=67298 RepID=UPI003F57F890